MDVGCGEMGKGKRWDGEKGENIDGVGGYVGGKYTLCWLLLTKMCTRCCCCDKGTHHIAAVDQENSLVAAAHKKDTPHCCC